MQNEGYFLQPSENVLLLLEVENGLFEPFKKDKMNYQKLSDYMQDEHGVILLESDMQEIVNICREMDSQKQPIDEVKEINDWYKALSIQESKDIAKKYGIEDKNGHPAWFMEIYEERKIAYYGEHSSPKLHPSITHLSTDKPLSEETLGIVNKMADMAKNEK